MRALLIVLLFLSVQPALGQQGSAEETGDPTESGDIVDVAATFGLRVKVVAYGLVFISICLLSISVPDAPLLLFVCSMPIVQFRGLRVALTLLQCAIVFVRTRRVGALVPSWPLSVFLLCVAASSSWALDPGASFLSRSGGVLDTFSLVPLIIATRALLHFQLTTTHRLLSALSFGCIPGCVLIIYNALSGIQWRGEAGYRMALLRPDIFSPLLVVSGLFLLFCITSPTVTRAGKLASLMLLPLICLSLLLTGIRSGWVAFGFGGLFWLLHRRSLLAWGGALALVALVALVAFGTAASLNLDEQLASRLSEGSLHTGETRLELWEVAARGFVQRPVLGIGWSCFPGFAADNTVGREIIAHNIFVRILCELGFVGFGLFMTWVAATILKLRRCSESGLVWLLMIGVLTQGLFLDLFVCAYFYVFLGMCDGVYTDAPSQFSYGVETANWPLPRRINQVAI